MKLERNIHTFIGCDSFYEESGIVIFGAPFDGTASYRPGSRFAPAEMRNESSGIETYSPYQDKDLLDVKVFDGGDLELPFGNTTRALRDIEKYTEGLIKDEKTPCMIGGEHLVTLGSLRAMIKKWPELNILHFDAHADLRDEYLGERLSHATVMRRCFELLKEGKLYQFGIRSGDREEFLFAKGRVHQQKFDFAGLDKVVEDLADKPVYLTVDLDVLDPSQFPGTGTPEAGGVCFKELLAALLQVKGLNIVGLDMNELSPTYDHSGISTALACKLLRELLLIAARP